MSKSTSVNQKVFSGLNWQIATVQNQKQNSIVSVQHYEYDKEKMYLNIVGEYMGQLKRFWH